ncbi:MAG TPA: T9SS type A sorting domain-containing protein, partial [Bacteroidia bacterium]|nr:T9SS type A sorting domain-containing protein [Bacteroidia bacterium]
ATTYTWTNDGSTTNPIIITPTVTTTYTVTGTDAFGCVGTKTRTIPIKTVPTVTVSAPASVCAGQTATLTATPTGTVTVGTYSWSTGSTTVTTTDTPTLTTTYVLVATGTGGGACSDTVKTTVVVNALPTVVANATKTNVCTGASTTLTGSGASTYSWTNGVTNGVAFAPTATQTYVVTGADVNGCMGTDSVTVNVLPRPTVTANATQTTVCAGSSVTLTGSGATTYTWTSGVTDGVAFTPTVTQTYTVAGTGANGCKNMDTLTVIVNNCMGINKITNIAEVSIYPNPAQNNFTIETQTSQQKAMLFMFDVNGKLVLNQFIADKTNIDISNLNAGVYSLNITTATGTLTKKLVIVK